MAWGTPTNLGSDNQAFEPVSFTVTASVPAGSLIVVVVGTRTTGAPDSPSVSDGKNTYTLAKQVINAAGDCTASIYYAYNVTALVNGVDTISFTDPFDAGLTDASVSAMYVTGTGAVDPFDAASDNSATGSSATPSVTSLTPADAGELFVGHVTHTGSTSDTDDPDWSFPQVPVNTSGGITTLPATTVNAGSGTLVYNPTLGASVPWAAAIVSFKLPLAGVNSQDDWPNPQRRRRTVPQDWIESGLALTTEDNPNQPRAPILWRRKPLVDESAAQSTLLGTPQPLYPVVAATPFNETDWPNPSRGPRRNPQDWSDSFKLPLQEVLPDNQYDWPNPRGPRRGVQDWTDSFKLPLQEIIQPNQYDWPNPRGPKRNPQDWVQATTTFLTVPPVFPANAQYDWPVPRGARRNPQDWSDSFKLPLQEVLPPHQTDWPVPKGPRRGVQDWIASTNIALLTFVAGKPSSQTDWPNPRGSRSNILLGWTDKLIVDILPPPGNYDQPNPRIARRNPQDWIGPTPNILTATPAATPPNNQTEWPVPRGPRRNPQDWFLSTPIPLTVTPAATPPNNQTDWPNPRAARRNPQDWSDSFKLPLQQTLPPTQKNWPLPTPARKRGPQDWILPVDLALYTTVQIKPPNRQWDWPVPKGPRQPVITTRYYVQGFTPPVAPVYNPDLTLKNEVRRIRFLDNTSGRIRYLKNEIRS